MSKQQLDEFIAATDASAARKQTFRDRAKGLRSAFCRAAGSSVAIARSITDGDLPQVTSKTDATAVARAVAGLKDIPKLELAQLLELMRTARNTVGDDSGARSQIRRAIARLDELYFGGFA